MRAFQLALIVILMALASSAAAAKCRARAGMTTFPGNTGWLHVWDQTGRKVGNDASLLCFTGTAKQLKEAKEGTTVAENGVISVKTGLGHDVSVQTTCDGQFIDTCSFQYGDFKSDTVKAKRGYSRGSCEIEFDC